MFIARQNGLLDGVVKSQWDIIQENVNNALQVAKMKVNGRDRWTSEDYQFAFMVKKGIIKIPKGPIWEPKTHMIDKDNASSIKRGLFNVKRWFGSPLDGSDMQYMEDPFPELGDVGGHELKVGNPFHASGSKSGRWDQTVTRNYAISNDDEFRGLGQA